MAAPTRRTARVARAGADSVSNALEELLAGRDSHMEGVARHGVGIALFDLGFPDLAEGEYQRALPHLRAASDLRTEALLLSDLARIRRAAGRLDASLRKEQTRRRAEFSGAP